MRLVPYLAEARSLPRDVYNDLTFAILLNRIRNGYLKTGMSVNSYQEIVNVNTLTDEAVIRIGRYLDTGGENHLIDAIHYLICELNNKVLEDEGRMAGYLKEDPEVKPYE